MKKNDYSVWVFTLPSGLEIHLRDVPQQDIDFLNNVEQLRAKVAELEAKLAKYENLEPFGFWHQGNDIDESDFFLYSESGDVSCSKCIKLYALEK